MKLKIELQIDSNKKKALKKILKDRDMDFELQKLIDRYVDDMILTHFRGSKKMDDALNEINT